MISVIHPSRGRPQKSVGAISLWQGFTNQQWELIISLDADDPKLNKYQDLYSDCYVIINNSTSAVHAIKNAAKSASGDILMVVSDDTKPIDLWSEKIHEEMQGKTDWILKTQDGIQNYIITNPIMDRAYYNRTGYIYHPDFQHMFCDTYLTCVADITGRKITSNLMFKHDHYSVNRTTPDALHKRNDATWKQGEELFIKLMKEFSPEERARITDPGMKNWLRNKGVR